MLSQTRFATIFLLYLEADFEKQGIICSPKEMMSQKPKWTSGRKEHGQMGWSPEGRMDNGQKEQWDLCLTKLFQLQEKGRGLVFIKWMDES